MFKRNKHKHETAAVVVPPEEHTADPDTLDTADAAPRPDKPDGPIVEIVERPPNATEFGGRDEETDETPISGPEHDPHVWVAKQGWADTSQIPVPDLLIDEVIGQDDAVRVAKKAARQGRHLLLLGDPGTGKSMIAKAMAQILPESRQDDVIAFPNLKDENQPTVRTMPGGEGRDFVRESTQKALKKQRLFTIFEWTVAMGLIAAGVGTILVFGGSPSVLMVALLCVLIAIFFLFVTRQVRFKADKAVPNLLIEKGPESVPAPYVDATGSHAGALLGDVRHDPYQSGGLETPTHMRIEPGAIHKAHKGLLFVDEINVLRLDSQQALLTAMQDKRYAITGQSDKSSGAMVRTSPVPCDFILVAAGNMDVIAPTDGKFTGLHPALRSRIRGYGYEVYVKAVMPDTVANRHKLVRFVAQEVRRDGNIPHFEQAAVAEVVREAQRRSGHTCKLTLRLRELGGLVRTAGDLARDDDSPVVTVQHVMDAKQMSMSLEYQVTRRGIEVTTAREALETTGSRVGSATGCTFLGTGETGEPAGIVVPVEADATISADRSKGGLFVGGGLEHDETLKDNVFALLKRLRGADMAGIDIHAQALLQQRGAETPSLGAPTAVACISALEDLPVKQDVVLIGALGVAGRLRGVDGVTQMVEAAADLGYTVAVVSDANRDDVLVEHRYRDKIEVVFVDHIADALPRLFDGSETRIAAVVNALRRTA